MYRQHEMLEDGQGKDDTGGQSEERWPCVNYYDFIKTMILLVS
jgi:hypothetical protein